MVDLKRQLEQSQVNIERKLIDKNKFGYYEPKGREQGGEIDRQVDSYNNRINSPLKNHPRIT